MAGKPPAAGYAPCARQGDFRRKRVRKSPGDRLLGGAGLSLPLIMEPATNRLIRVTALALLMLTLGIPAFAQVTKVIADCEGIT